LEVKNEWILSFYMRDISVSNSVGADRYDKEMQLIFRILNHMGRTK
jgi:hypothetical protein